ncbi:MAG: hypothetical protein IPO93_10230 [Actinobacteria bacterium]|jgi:hypothetical protein|nr:hypothetical protein [Actinomycetota bacterium]
MTSTDDVSGNGHATFLTEDDEMSLAEAKTLQTEESVPDTLEVRSDAVAVMRDSMAPMRQPLMIAAAVVGVAVAVILVGGILGRALRRGGTPSA